MRRPRGPSKLIKLRMSLSRRMSGPISSKEGHSSEMILIRLILRRRKMIMITHPIIMDRISQKLRRRKFKSKQMMMLKEDMTCNTNKFQIQLK